MSDIPGVSRPDGHMVTAEDDDEGDDGQRCSRSYRQQQHRAAEHAARYDPIPPGC